MTNTARSTASKHEPPAPSQAVVAVCNTRPDNVTPTVETSPMSNAPSPTGHAPEPRPAVTVLASGIDTLHLFSRAMVAHTELRRLLTPPSSRRA